MKHFLVIPVLLLLAACGGMPASELPTRLNPLPDHLPPMKAFSATAPQTSRVRANSDIARDFLELTFEMESGRAIDRMTRFEGPVTIALAQSVSPQFAADLAALLLRLRREAGIDIHQTETGQPANIVIQTLPRRQLQATVPHAACFVVPRVANWAEFRKNRRSGRLDWATLKRRERATVFIPADVSPQEARDCMHEEVAQALGPLNDIYRLDDSIFNDDNINLVLTGFDMLILRAYYHPSLKNGMTRAEVAERLPHILSGLNPSGRLPRPDRQEKTPRAWINAIESALAPRVPRTLRLTHARKALKIATDAGWYDNRMGFSLFVQGRLALGLDGRTAVDSFTRAYQVYSDNFGKNDIHTAHVALQLAAFSLSQGDTGLALRLINDSLPSVARSENAALLAAFLMIKAEALDFEGHPDQAALVRLDSLGWARYGFASDDDIRARLKETAALRPRGKPPGVG